MSEVIESDGAERHRIKLVPEPSAEFLNERQRLDYKDHRERLIEWMLNLGKNPAEAKGYAFDTVRRRALDIDNFLRWVWKERGSYTTEVTHENADDYMRNLVYEDYSDTHKANTQKSLKMYFRWRENPWEPEIHFSGRSSGTQPRDFLTREERTRLREAALEYGTVPAYDALTPSEKEEWVIHLAQRFRKSTSEIGRQDFERANGFKIPSIISTALDAALRPIEVGRARTHWVDTDNAVLRIPAEEASKGDHNWTVSLTERTARMLDRWLEERDLYEAYDDTDRLWLTRERRPYSSRSLNYLLDNLCDLADIATENRSITFYAIRHSTGTYLAREEGLAATQAQLRHRSLETAARYDQAPVEDRRDALDRIG